MGRVQGRAASPCCGALLCCALLTAAAAVASEHRYVTPAGAGAPSVANGTVREAHLRALVQAQLRQLSSNGSVDALQNEVGGTVVDASDRTRPSDVIAWLVELVEAGEGSAHERRAAVHQALTAVDGDDTIGIVVLLSAASAQFSELLATQRELDVRARQCEGRIAASVAAQSVAAQTVRVSTAKVKAAELRAAQAEQATQRALDAAAAAETARDATARAARDRVTAAVDAMMADPSSAVATPAPNNVVLEDVPESGGVSASSVFVLGTMISLVLRHACNAARDAAAEELDELDPVDAAPTPHPAAKRTAPPVARRDVASFTSGKGPNGTEAPAPAATGTTTAVRSTDASSGSESTGTSSDDAATPQSPYRNAVAPKLAPQRVRGLPAPPEPERTALKSPRDASPKVLHALVAAVRAAEDREEGDKVVQEATRSATEAAADAAAADAAGGGTAGPTPTQDVLPPADSVPRVRRGGRTLRPAAGPLGNGAQRLPTSPIHHTPQQRARGGVVAVNTPRPPPRRSQPRPTWRRGQRSAHADRDDAAVKRSPPISPATPLKGDSSASEPLTVEDAQRSMDSSDRDTTSTVASGDRAVALTMLCRSCLDPGADHVLVPCEHMLCAVCAPLIVARVDGCPACGLAIDACINPTE